MTALRADVPQLPEAIGDLAAAHRVNHGTEVTLRIAGTPRALDSEPKMSLLRTAREALTNAARHAPGVPVRLDCEFADGAVRLTVTNPATATTTTGGHGLIGARERLALVGGTLTAGVVDGVWRVEVVVLTTYADDDSIAGALRAGARGYLTKDAGRAEIGMALRAAATGHAMFAPVVSARLADAINRPMPAPRSQLPDGLTPREAEVLGQLGSGRTNAEIAAGLFVTEATVKTHLNNAFAKIGARNRTEAAGYAARQGL